MITLPASSLSFRGSHPWEAAHQRPSGPSHSTRTDRSTITSPTQPRSRTQISPGIHGAIPDPTPHNHSPPALTRAHVQISTSRLVVLTVVDAEACAYAGVATNQRRGAPAPRGCRPSGAVRTRRDKAASES